MNGDRTQKPLLIFLVTEDHYFYSHRLPAVRAARQAGMEVALVTNVQSHKDRIEAEGVRVIPLSLERKSLNPLKALGQINRLTAIYKAEQPVIVHHIGMKPILYGAIAALRCRVPVYISAFAGLGYVFSAQSFLARVIRVPLVAGFRLLLKRPPSRLLFQNGDDLALLDRYKIVPAGRAVVIKGSGVDLGACPLSPYPSTEDGFIAVFAGRMIDIKGLQTLKDAFALLDTEAPHIRLWLCGRPDPANPGSWTEEKLRAWDAQSDNVVYKGHQTDMAALWSNAHCALQPSYGGEGVPKSLLEAAACGRPIIATDVPGCREMVEEERNGFLVSPRDARALADALVRLASDSGTAAHMGEESRKLVKEKGLSTESVIALTADFYRACLQSASQSL